MEKKVDAPRRPKLGRGSRQIPDRRRHGDARTPALCVSKTDRDAIVAHFAPWAARMLRVQHSPPPPAKRMRKRRGAHKKMRREKKKKGGRCERTFYPFVHKLQVRPQKLKVGLPAARGVRRRVLGQDKGAGERGCGACGRSDGRVTRGFECEQSGSDQRPATAGQPRWPPALTETLRARCGGSGVPKRRPGRPGQLATINRSARLPSRPIRRLLNPTFTNFHRPESCTCWLSKLRQPRSHGLRAPESDEKMLIPED